MHEEASRQAQVSTEMAREHLCLVRSRALQGALTIERGGSWIWRQLLVSVTITVSSFHSGS